jgi:anti-anti-sigma factor
MTHVLHANCLSLSLPGNLLSTSVESLRKEVFGLIDSLAAKRAIWTKLHVDINEAKLVDSAGLNLLVSIIRTAKTTNATVSIGVSNKTVHRTLLFTRLDRHVELIAS